MLLKPKEFALNEQVKQTSTVKEPSIRFHTTVKLVDAEAIAIKKVRILNLRLEINNVTPKMEFQSLSVETYDRNHEVMFTQTSDPDNQNSFQLRK